MAGKIAEALEAGESGVTSGDQHGRGSGGSVERGQDDGANLGNIRERLGISEEEIGTLDPSEFTAEELEQLRGSPAGGDGGAGDDEGAGEGDGEDDADGSADDTARQEIEGGPPPKGYVSVAALRQTRSELAELKNELAEHRRFRDTLATRLLEQRTQQERQQQQTEQQKQLGEIPDEQKDPVGTIAWLKAQLLRKNEEETQQRQQVQQRTQEQQQFAERAQATIDQADQVLVQSFQTDPEVQEAFEFGAAAVRAELEANGLRGEKLDAAFNDALFKYSIAAPKDPAKMAMYVRRNARYWGWDPGKKFGEQNQQQPNSNQGGQGQRPAPKKIVPQSRLQQLKAAQQRNGSLSGGGMPGGGELSLADLAEMSGAELEKLAEENPQLFEAASRRE